MSQFQVVTQHRNKNRYRWWIAGVLLLVGIAVFLLSHGEIITLHAGEPIALGASPFMAPIGNNLVATLSAGEEAQVIECRNTKSDLVIQLRTKTGEKGYVAGGNYLLMRKKAGPYSLIYEFDLVTFSCRGMYEKRSHYSNGSQK